MPRIYVQRGSAEGYEQNISSTLAKPLSRETIGRVSGIVGPDRTLAQRVEVLINQGPLYVWGTKTRGRSEIARMRPGDLAIFVVGGTPACYGTVSEVIADDVPVEMRRSLSKEFWGSEAWEYVWFLSGVSDTKLPRPQLESLLGQPLGSFFGSPYASFRGVDEKDTAIGVVQAALDSLKRGTAPKETQTTVANLEPADPELELMRKLLKAKKQIILYGPPGTGKTHRAIELAASLAPNVISETVQFHPSYTYEEFVVGIKPLTKDGQVTFAPTDGVFKSLCDRARSNPRHPYVMIVDEINRGNIPKIFGELLFALEYRNVGIRLPYITGSEPWMIPDNVHLIGSMNTADRSIALIDVALRRRFYFIEMRPDYELLEEWLRENATEEMANEIPRLLGTMNARITRLLDRDHEIGHTYFMKKGIDWPTLRTIMYHEIIPLLQEYFYNEPQRLMTVLGPGFVIEPKEEAELGGAFYELVPNRTVSEFKDAIRQLMTHTGPPYVTP